MLLVLVMFKRDADGNILTSTGSEYYDDRIPFEGMLKSCLFIATYNPSPATSDSTDAFSHFLILTRSLSELFQTDYEGSYHLLLFCWRHQGAYLEQSNANRMTCGHLYGLFSQVHFLPRNCSLIGMCHNHLVFKQFSNGDIKQVNNTHVSKSSYLMHPTSR